MEILTKNQPEQKHRFIILTDMENEPDDSQTMVRLLTYSNEIDIEGLVAVTSRWLKDEVYPESILYRVQAYGVVRPNLMKHADGWPTEASLTSKIASGPVGYGMPSVGDGKNTDGSNLILEAAAKDDPRPIYIAINAGANTLAQAIWDARRLYSAADFQKFLSKLRVYDDSGQDNCGAWICHNFPELFYIRSHPQVFALYGPKMGAGPHVWAETTIRKGEEVPYTQWKWAERNVRTRHGILGALFPQRQWEKGTVGFMDGGGSTCLLGLANKGLYEPEQISWGGWGGRFSWDKMCVRAGQRGVAETEDEYLPFEMYPQAADNWGESGTIKLWDGEWDNSFFAPVWRWRQAYTNDFQARMDWCVVDYEHANHPPVAAFYGDTNRTIVRVRVAPGDPLELDASASSDPDGDPLTFNWYLYPEAGTYTGNIEIAHSDQSVAKLQIPSDAAETQLHIILEVSDQNEIVNLTSYRRIVIDVV